MRFDDRQQAVRSSLALGFRPTTKLLLNDLNKDMEFPLKNRILAEDNIPFLCSTPEMNNFYDTLDFSQGCFTLFVSPPGAGKTFALRGLIDTLFQMGYHVVDLSSIKNNFYYGMRPVQAKFRHLLPPWRKEKALPVVPFLPAYLKKYTKSKKYMNLGQIQLQNIRPIDLIKSTLGLKQTDTQAQLLQSAWGKRPPKNIFQLIKRTININATMRRRLDIITKFDSFASASIRSMKKTLEVLMNDEVFGDTYPMDFVKIINEGKIPSLCFNYDRRHTNYHSTYIAALISQVYNAKVAGKIKGRIVFVFDDMGTLVAPGGNKNPSCKDLVKNDLIALGRELGIYVIGTTQNLGQIPEEIINQVKHMVFFGNISGNDLEKIAKVRNIRLKALRESMKRFSPLILPNGMRSAVVWSVGKRGIRGQAQYGWIPACSHFHHEQE